MHKPVLCVSLMLMQLFGLPCPGSSCYQTNSNHYETLENILLYLNAKKPCEMKMPPTTTTQLCL